MHFLNNLLKIFDALEFIKRVSGWYNFLLIKHFVHKECKKWKKKCLAEIYGFFPLNKALFNIAFKYLQVSFFIGKKSRKSTDISIKLVRCLLNS